MNRLNAWLSAFRLRTLPLALSGILLGSLLAYNDGFFNLRAFFLSLLTASLLQILSNLANDLGDAQHGADNEHRIGPTRAIQSGDISKNQMKSAVILLSIIAFISGLALLYTALWYRPNRWNILLVFLGIGVVSIAAAIKYTMGKNPYGYRAMGDIFVFLFFGITAVVGVYYLHGGTLSWHILLPGASIGLLSAGVLNLNNMRDAVEDKKVGKMTLPVLLGVKKSHSYHTLLMVAAPTFALTYVLISGDLPYGLLFLLLFPIIFLHLKKVHRVMPVELNPELKKIALFTLVFALLLGFGCILS